MSVDVLREVFRHSTSRGTDRCVLIVLADAAHSDGVTWIPQGPKVGLTVDPKCLAHRANCSLREVERSIQELEALGEIQVRKAQRGRRRINVYRVLVGDIADTEVEYDRLPFKLSAPFARPDNLSGRQRADSQVDDPTSRRSRPDDLSLDDPTSRRLYAGASVQGTPHMDPSLEPAAEEQELSVLRAELPRTVEESLTSAAAVVGEPAPLELIVNELGRFRNADFGSLRIIEPLARSLPATVFDDVLARVRRRCMTEHVTNDVGYLVQLLRIALGERHLEEQRQRAAQLSEAVRQHEESRRRSPEAYVDRLTNLPSVTDIAGVDRFLARFITDETERARLHEYAEQRLNVTGPGLLRRWIREEAPRVAIDLGADVVHQEIDALAPLVSHSPSHEDIALLHELAEQVLNPRPALTIVGDREAIA